MDHALHSKWHLSEVLVHTANKEQNTVLYVLLTAMSLHGIITKFTTGT